MGGKNIEIARGSNKPYGSDAHAPRPWNQMMELVEAIILSLVALLTAWSGYQAARWGGVQGILYARSSRLRVEGQTLQVQANQIRQYNAATVSDWIQAQSRNDTKLADFYERRFLPDFRPAFQAWKKTDPLHNPNAPVGPSEMPQYHDVMGDEATAKNDAATKAFEEGTRARAVADEYIRATVGLATVLFLTAMGQRFRSSWIRAFLVALAFMILCIPLWRIIWLPRA
jgi:heme/copper-type cytochrome/quinol oxidase subunit 4